MKSNLLPIANEGVLYVASSVLALFIFSIFDFDFLSFLSFIAIFVFVFIYRNPEREMPAFEKNAVLSPVDGSVISIEELKEDASYGFKVQIQSSYFDVSLLRAPITSTVNTIKYTHGTRIDTSSELSTKLNENMELVFVNEQDCSVKVVHTLKQSFDTLNISLSESQKVYQGVRYGTMLCGITSLYLPKNFKLNVHIRSDLKASETPIGYFA